MSTPHDSPISREVALESRPHEPGTRVNLAEWVDQHFEAGRSALDVAIRPGVSLREARRRSVRYFLGDQYEHSAPEGVKQFTINKFEPAVMAITAAQLEQAPLRSVAPVETGDPPSHFLTENGLRRLARAAATIPGVFEALRAAGVPQLDALKPLDPLPDAVVEALLPLTRPQPNPVGRVLQPAVLGPRELVRIDDAVRAKVFQRLLDKMAELGFLHHHIRTAQVLSNIVGDCPILYRWDRHRQRSVYRVPHWLNVVYDPKSNWIEDANWAGLEEEVELSAAINEYPEHQALLERVASQGTGESDEPRPYAHVQRPLPTVRLRTLWKRYTYYCPMLPEEAQRQGRVRIIEESRPVVGSDGAAILDDGGKPLVEVVTRYELPDGVPTLPGEKSWPAKLCAASTPGARCGIRQLTVLADAGGTGGEDHAGVLDDRECPYADIPLTYVKASPIPYNPHGMPDGNKLRDNQDTINFCYTVIVSALRARTMGPRYMIASLYDLLKSAEGALSGTPFATYRIDDAVYAEMMEMTRGNLTFNESLPPFPDWAVKMLEVALAQDNELSGHVEVLQGKTPFSNISGKAVATLASQARGPLGFRAASMTDALTYLARIEMQAILDWMADEEWERYLAEYPAGLRDMLRESVRALSYDVSVEVVGQAEQKQVRSITAIEDFDRGVISRATYLERRNYPDPENELDKRRSEDVAAMASQPVTDPTSAASP